jgi:aminopeptidase N
VFDQPDLKATMKFTIIAHSDWTVISNQSAVVETKPDGNKRWAFPPTLRLSSYLFTVIAGPFREIKCPIEKCHKNIPQSIFCRETLYKYVEKQQHDIFEFNADAIRRYEELFGFDYPFSKADSIFCPEYTVGAMENPGAVTYTESYAYTKVPTTDEITDRATTIIHELAHMWFGDLVTMKWWNDLWLNEAFADFVNYIVLDDMYGNMSFPVARSFSLMNFRKGGGYRADQMKNTHPIAGVVEDTDVADGIFDGITYNKGAAVMRQLFALIGRPAFSKAMKIYFHKFAYSNATLQDLLGVMQGVVKEEHGGSLDYEVIGHHLDLKQFEEDWIKKAGCNSVLAKWDQKDKSKNAKLTLVQDWTLEEHQTLRYHKMRVGFYAEDGSLLEAKDVILQNKTETVLEYDGSMNVAAVVPNYDDLTFIKILMDDTTCDWMKSNMAKLPEELTRSMVLRSLFEMVRDARGIKSHEFVELCLESYPKETSVTVADNIETFQRVVLSAYVLPEHKDALKQKAFDVAYSMLATTTDEDRRSNLADMLRTNTKSAASLEVMKNWYEGTDAMLKGLEPNLDQKYGIILDLMGSGKYPAELTNEMVAKVEAEDTTDTKKRNETIRKWMMATEAEKSEAWTLMVSKESPWSYAVARDVMSGMLNEWVPYEQREKLYNRYFDDLSLVLNERSREFAKVIFIFLKEISTITLMVRRTLMTIRFLLISMPQ